MEATYERKYHQLEKQHWWFVGRRAIIAQLLKKVPKGAQLLEIGCSSGIFLQLLKQKGYNHVTGIDISKQAIANCKRQRLQSVSVMDGAQTKFKTSQFDVIIASDVLEHIKQDTKALKEWKRILKPNGLLIVFVPAFPLLWSQHDVHNQHCRRYTKTTLRQLLSQAGFSSSLRISYWNTLLFLPTIAIRLLQRLLHKKGKKKDNLHETPAFLNGLFLLLLRFEHMLLRFINLPVGVSVFAVVRA